MKLRRLASFAAASALIIGLLGQGASTVFGYDGVEQWTGQGTTDGQLNSSECDESGTPFLLWVFTPGGGQNTITAVDLILGGSGTGTIPFDQDNGQWKAESDFFDLDTLTAEADFWGAPGNGAVNLVISHGCAGETTTTTSSSSTTTSSSSTTTTSSSTTTTTTTTEPTTTTTSFSQTVSATTDVAGPTLPNTAAIETGAPSSTNNSVWMLIVALGVLLGSVVILTPAPSKAKR